MGAVPDEVTGALEGELDLLEERRRDRAAADGARGDWVRRLPDKLLERLAHGDPAHRRRRVGLDGMEAAPDGEEAGEEEGRVGDLEGEGVLDRDGHAVLGDGGLDDLVVRAGWQDDGDRVAASPVLVDPAMSDRRQLHLEELVDVVLGLAELDASGWGLRGNGRVLREAGTTCLESGWIRTRIAALVERTWKATTG